MRFKRIYIEITNICNLTCPFCTQNKRVERQMKLHEFVHILRQVHLFSKHIYLHVLGEPLLHPELDAFLRVASSYGMHVHITSNGTLLKDCAAVLRKHKSIQQINVSLHSLSHHAHTSYLQDVFTTSEALASQGLYMNYRLWSLQNQMLDETSAHILDCITMRYGIELKAKDCMRMKRHPLQKNISLHFEEVFTWPSQAQPFLGRHGRCLGMVDMCAILSDGSLVPCCLDGQGECVLGNVFTQPFSEIIASKKAEDIRQGFIQHRVVATLCQHCSYRLRFS